MSRLGQLKEFIVHDEVWESESYRPLWGKWQSPMSKPRFSDLIGKKKLSSNTESLPNKSPPDGWEIVSEWMLWPRASKITSDHEGWMYGSDTTDIITKLRTSGLDLGSENAKKSAQVRRRKWVRARKCVTDEGKERIKEELKWLQSIVDNLKNYMRQKQMERSQVTSYENVRVKAYKKNRATAARKVLAYKEALDYYAKKLQELKDYMRERKEIDREYGRKLQALSKQYAKNSIEQDIISNSDSKEFTPGFFSLVSTGGVRMGAVMESLSCNLALENWVDMDTCIADVAALQRKCEVEALDLWKHTRALEHTASEAFNTYDKTFQRACQLGALCMENIINLLAAADATGVLEVQDLATSLGKGSVDASFAYGGASSALGLYVPDPNNDSNKKSVRSTNDALTSDVFCHLNAYRIAIVQSQRGHDSIDRFASFVERDTRTIASKVADVLRRATEVLTSTHGTALVDVGKREVEEGSYALRTARSMTIAASGLKVDVPDTSGNGNTNSTSSSMMNYKKTSISSPNSNSDDNGQDSTTMSPDKTVSLGDGSLLSPPPNNNSHSGSGTGSVSSDICSDADTESVVSAKNTAIVDIKGTVDQFDMNTLPPGVGNGCVVARGIFTIATLDDARSFTTNRSQRNLDGSSSSSSSSDRKTNENNTGGDDDGWTRVTAVVTAEGFLHIFLGAQIDMGDVRDTVMFRDSTDGRDSMDARDSASWSSWPTRDRPSLPVRSVNLGMSEVRLSLLRGLADGSALEVTVNSGGSIRPQAPSTPPSGRVDFVPSFSMIYGSSADNGRNSNGSNTDDIEKPWMKASKIVLRAFNRSDTDIDTSSNNLKDWIRLLVHPLANPSLAPSFSA